MSRRQIAQLIVCTAFLLLIAMSVHSMYVESESESAAEELHESVSLRTTFTGSARYAGRRAHAEEPAAVLDLRTSDDAVPDAGVDEVFARELALCIATDCMSRRRHGDGGAIYAALPPPPPKAR